MRCCRTSVMVGYAVVVSVVLLDQITKLFALSNLSAYQSVRFLPGFSWTLVFNSGSAFGFLARTGAWHTGFLLLFSFGMIGLIVVWIQRLKDRRLGLERCGLSFILGGAIGNCIDRLRFGYVIDFIDWFIHGHHWPVFNIADSAICLGALLLVYQSWRASKI